MVKSIQIYFSIISSCDKKSNALEISIKCVPSTFPLSTEFFSTLQLGTAVHYTPF